VTRYLKHTRLLAGALALIVGLTLVAPPAFAATPGPIAAAAAAKIDTVPAEALAQAAQTTPAAQAAPAAAAAETGNKPFFKSPKGIVALVLTIGATAWLIQSRNSNKVTSPGRQ
jgi:hypothetical protein